MPPKPKYSKEEILHSALNLVRKHVYKALTIRQLAAQLKISTQPIMSCFESSEQLRQEVWQSADLYHTHYLMKIDETSKDSIPLQIGMNYIRFASQENHLFHWLFLNEPGSESSFQQSQTINQLIEDPALDPILNSMSTESGISSEMMKRMFRILMVYIHGYACLIADQIMEVDEEQIRSDLVDCWNALQIGLDETSGK